MSIRKLLVATSFALSFSGAAFALPQAGNYAIDPAHSNVSFSVNHMGYANIVGRFNEFSGSINIAEKGKSQLAVAIKTASVDSNHEKRDEHLRSPDFFNAKQFPEITFTSPLSLSSDGKTLSGEIEILGVKKPVTLSLEKGNEAKDPWGLYRIGYTASTSIKRSDFGMDFMAGGIGDDVAINLQIEAVKQ